MKKIDKITLTISIVSLIISLISIFILLSK
ncbi:hypothetical protein SAMN04488529_101721 [Clostridium gasigenes]|uniref:Uncharacterized protein n=1 Tax=Clostridium gasigenes TaxID=94869 RepID=A0A1H0N7I4_9CLOT|nr:hypothetical protein SAMN04488529_101721 [Clostridium gasigenes]